MEPARDGVLLRVFIGAADRSGGHRLCRAIIDVAFKGGLAERWFRLFGQFFRFDKWTFRRV